MAKLGGPGTGFFSSLGRIIYTACHGNIHASTVALQLPGQDVLSGDPWLSQGPYNSWNNKQLFLRVHMCIFLGRQAVVFLSQSGRDRVSQPGFRITVPPSNLPSVPSTAKRRATRLIWQKQQVRKRGLFSPEHSCPLIRAKCLSKGSCIQ